MKIDEYYEEQYEERSEKKLRGFTLIELIVVITIIGILASIIVPTFMDHMERANNVADAENARIISSAIRAEAMDGTNLEVFTLSPWKSGKNEDGTDYDADDHGYIYVSKTEVRVSSYQLALLLQTHGFISDATKYCDKRASRVIDGKEIAQYTYDRSVCKRMLCKSGVTWYRYQINVCNRDDTVIFTYSAVSHSGEVKRTSNQSDPNNTQDKKATETFAEKAGMGEPDYTTSFGPVSIIGK